MASFFNSLDISATGMRAQRLRLDVISSNIANASTTRTAEGGPYRARTVIFEEINPGPNFGNILANEIFRQGQPTGTGNGVRVREIVTNRAPGPMEFDPNHPDANAEGYIERSNVNIVFEMVNMLSASRSYEANVTAFNTTKSMIAKTLEISGA